MATSLPISLPFVVRGRGGRPFPFRHSTLSLSSSASVICFSNQNPSGYDREEVRWLREEQRWLREEQRWLREEQRWLAERQSLLREVSDLKLRIEDLESRNFTQGATVAETISNIGALLQVLKEKSRITDSGSSSAPLVLEEEREREEGEEDEEKQITEAEKIKVSDIKKKMRTLKAGSEGEEVREMQEALLKIGFYSGEEDMEYSSFSSGTVRAVKTWQATLGLPEDGIMTGELLQRLYMDEPTDRVLSNNKTDKEEKSAVKQEEAGNGTAITSVSGFSETSRSIVKDEGATEVEVSHHRVFLLGENRWEEPSRLVDMNKPENERKPTDIKPKCLTCRGEGRLMCTECDGTGDMNVEPQFLEWVEEGAKCPYCDGLGYVVCDVCEGKAA